MSTATVKPVSDVLFGRTRRVLLALFFTRPDERFYLRQITRRTGLAMGAVQRELNKLSAAAILRREEEPGHVYYRAETSSPIFAELRNIVIKTAGVAEIIFEALRPWTNDIGVAFVFGSFANGGHGKGSDLDLLVVGNVPLALLTEALQGAQEKLGREINPVLVSPKELRTKLRAGHHFLTSVMSGPKLFVLGGAHELGQVAAVRMAEDPRDVARGDRGLVARRRA